MSEVATKPRRGCPRKHPQPEQPETVGQLVDSLPPVNAVLGATAAPERPAVRQPVREEDPREAARRRAAEIMPQIQDELDHGVDEFYFDPKNIPDGWTYEWKRHKTAGAEDPTYQVTLRKAGWTPVPAARHPEMMPAGSNHQVIERKGMLLMERPAEVTAHFRARDNQAARDAVRAKEAQLTQAPPGQFERSHQQVQPKINKGYEPVEIPS